MEIALELWALPRAAYSDFPAGIPAPLSIGTIALADGAASHGALLEAAGVQRAEDITHLGGWRAYLAQTMKMPEPSG